VCVNCCACAQHCQRSRSWDVSHNRCQKFMQEKYLKEWLGMNFKSAFLFFLSYIFELCFLFKKSSLATTTTLLKSTFLEKSLYIVRHRWYTAKQRLFSSAAISKNNIPLAQPIPPNYYNPLPPLHMNLNGMTL
jgi:hypothetical protein